MDHSDMVTITLSPPLGPTVGTNHYFGGPRWVHVEGLTAERVARYLDTTRRALEKVRVVAPERSHARRIAEDFLGMVEAYRRDAQHFVDKGDLVNAFAAINYAHGWLDAGARLGLFDTGGDDRLFTLAE